MFLHPTENRKPLGAETGRSRLAQSDSNLYTTCFPFQVIIIQDKLLAPACCREVTRGFMGRLRCGKCASVVALLSLSLFVSACGGHAPPGASPFPVKITLNPSSTASIQLGNTLFFSASAQNNANSNIAPTFSFTSSNPSVFNISPTGFGCAGTWNAPFYNVCTPAGIGMVQVTASALGAISPPTLVFVHPPIDNIQVSVVPPVNPPPPACPAQTALPTACNIKFNSDAINHCLSQNQAQTLQATAFSNGVDITSSVGEFTWSASNFSVVKITPIVNTTTNVVSNQATVVSDAPGQTQVIASASGVSSQPTTESFVETCPVQCITLDLSVNGEFSGQTSFVTNKGTSETINATAVDVQGCVVPNPPLSWTSSSPAALTPGSASAGCAAGSSCVVSTAQPGGAAITASCSPPTCNVGFPLNPAGVPALYVPQPVYPVTAVSGLVTGATTAASVLATSQDCSTNALCTVALYDISTTRNIAASPSSWPTPPNSLMFSPAGDKAYSGSQYGALLINTSNLGSSSSSPFSSLPAPATPSGQVTGRVLAVSANGSQAVFSDTISSPNQVYIVNTSGTPSSTALNINGASAAAFSPDELKAFILGDGGNTLYVYSGLQSLQTHPLSAPTKTIAFSSTGGFAMFAGGSSSSNITIRNTCDNSPVNLSFPNVPAPPTFLKMVPPGNVPTGTIIPSLQQQGLDVFYGVDNSGIDIIATTTTTPLSPPSTLCPLQQIALAQTQQSTTFDPLYINLQKGTFHPISVFLTPDLAQVYIVTSDLGVLVYSFLTQSTSAIQLNGGAAPVAADMTVDGSLLYVAGTDGLLHELDTVQASDVMQIPFTQLPNSNSNFCYQSFTCALNIVAIKP